MVSRVQTMRRRGHRYAEHIATAWTVLLTLLYLEPPVTKMPSAFQCGERLPRPSAHFSAELILFDLMKAMPCVLMWVFKAASVSNVFAHTLHLLSDAALLVGSSSWLGLFSCWLSSPDPFCFDTGCGSFSLCTMKRCLERDTWDV